jgi:formylglycine-generating enzyme required for sulfatase activity
MGAAGLMLVCGVAVATGPAAQAQSYAPLTAAQERALKAKDTFQECEHCPEMVVVPAGAFTMGSPENEKDRRGNEGPQHTVTIGRPFAVGKFHVTRDQFAAFVNETGYVVSYRCHALSDPLFEVSWRDPGFAQDGSHPAVCVTWDGADAYANWLAKKTGKPYRLLSEAEWEYAARGRTQPGVYPRFWFGDDEQELCRYGNFSDRKGGRKDTPCDDGYQYTSPVGHYLPNPFGLFDMFGNAMQWTADCYHENYNGAPADGTAWTTDCKGSARARVMRGHGWASFPRDLRAAYRARLPGADPYIGFRLARTLNR